MLIFELILNNGERRIVFANSSLDCYTRFAYLGINEINLITIH